MIDYSIIYCSICYQSKLETIANNKNLSFYVSTCARIYCENCYQQQLIKNISCLKCSKSNCQKLPINEQSNSNILAFFSIINVQQQPDNCQYRKILSFQQIQLKRFEQFLQKQFLELYQLWNNSNSKSFDQLKMIDNEKSNRIMELKNILNDYKSKDQRSFEEQRKLRQEQLHRYDQQTANMGVAPPPQVSTQKTTAQPSSVSNSIMKDFNITQSSSSTINKFLPMMLNRDNYDAKTTTTITRKTKLTSSASSLYAQQPNRFAQRLDTDLSMNFRAANSIYDRLYRKASPSIYSAMSSVHRARMNYNSKFRM